MVEHEPPELPAAAVTAGDEPRHPHPGIPVDLVELVGRVAIPEVRGPAAQEPIDMFCHLIESVQTRWRAVNAPHLVALVRAGATFINGKLVERPTDHDQQGGDRKAA
jgi:hypothetical protein